MANVATITPLNQFFDTNGSPLNSGYLYFGSANQDPEHFPVQMYWDEAATIPAVQPIRTISGYPSRAGSPAIIYGPDSYSLRVKNSASVQVVYAPSLGGLATSASLSASGGSALVGFLQDGAGAILRNVQSKLRESVSVKDFGAVGDGVTDDTQAFQKAHDSLPASGGRIFAPSGTYKLTGAITFTKPVLLEGALGGNTGATTFTTNHATADIFIIATGFAAINFAITSSVTRTAGAFFKGSGGTNRLYFGNFWASAYYIAIDIDGGSEIRIENASIFDGTAGTTASGSCALRFGNTSYTADINLAHLYIKCQNGAAQCSFGVLAKYVDVMTLNGVTIIQHGTDFQVAPGNGQTASLIYADGSTFDTAVNGVVLAPTGTGNVIRCAFGKCWMGVHTTNGVAIDGASGTVDDVSFSGCVMTGNTSCGINITGANAKNIRVNGNTMAANGLAGVRITTNATNIRVFDNDIGAIGGASGNVTGIATDSTVSGEIRGNNVSGNTTNLSVASNAMLGIWNTWTSTVTATSGTLTTVSSVAAFVQTDKTVYFRVAVTITTNGTGAGGINVTLPAAARASSAFSGRATGVSGKQLQGFVAGAASTMVVYNYDGTYPGANGEVLVISGTYEIV